MWMTHSTKARYAISTPVVVMRNHALTRDAFDLMRTLCGGTSLSVKKCAMVYQEMHSRTQSRRKLCAMLHEEEAVRNGFKYGGIFASSPNRRKKFTAADVGMVRPLGRAFWRKIIVDSLENDEEYQLLFNEQVNTLAFAVECARMVYTHTLYYIYKCVLQALEATIIAVDISRKAGKGIHILQTKFCNSTLSIMNEIGQIILCVMCPMESLKEGACRIGLDA